MTEILVAVALALLTILLVLSLFGKKKSGGPIETPLEESAGSKVSNRRCPLCGELLKTGEKVHSVVFATKTDDKIMEISGCPHCRPDSTKVAALKRLCPVCKKELRPQDVVTARVFERKDETRKTHIHVLGCPRCRRS